MNDTTPARFLPFEGSINFRDFGGYPTVDGRRVKWRRLFRSGALAFMSQADHVAFNKLDIGVICDLRSQQEADNLPSPEDAPFNVRKAIPILQASASALRASMKDPRQSADDRVNFMTRVTQELASSCAAEYRELFAQLQATENGFLLHCSAGKDRTGFGAALILAGLGVDEGLIMEDYLLTNQAVCLRNFMRQRTPSFYGATLDDASLDAIAGVRAGYLQAALREVTLRHGGLLQYLDDIGVDAEARRRLQDRLLE